MRKIMLVTAALAAVTTSVSPVLANGLDDLLSNRNQMRMGFYFKVPFSGGLKATKENVASYGFGMGYSRSFTSGTSFYATRDQVKIDLMAIKFSEAGFDNFSLGGRDQIVWTKNSLGVAESGAVGMGSLAIGAVAVLGGVVALGGGSAKDSCITNWGTQLDSGDSTFPGQWFGNINC